MKALIVVCLLLLVGNSYAVECNGIDSWVDRDIYLGGDQVKHVDSLYQAKWWTTNENPGSSSVWHYMGSCTDQTDEPSGEISECNGLRAWHSGTVYVGGDLISHQGNKYRANWWTQDNDPASHNGDTGSGQPWTLIATCTPFGNGGTGDGGTGSTGSNNSDSSSSRSSISSGNSSSSSSSSSGEPANTPPIANANGPYRSTVNQNIVFYSAGSMDPDGDIISFSWDFGDGTTSSNANPEHRYTTAGHFFITLTVTDSSGAQTSVSTSAVVETPQTPPSSGDKKVVGYFTEWGVYGRNYHVKNLVTSSSAEQLTHIIYAFGNTTGGRCSIGDTYAAYDKAYSAADSVDGVADTWDTGALRGNFNQLRKLKKQYPGVKVIWSFGGWTWSGGFSAAAKNPEAFAESCYQLVNDERWSGVFDGIDIDWEYPNDCGLSCDSSGYDAYRNLVAALRSRFGNQLVTSAITASATKMESADYGGAARYLDFYMVMTYDFFGAFAASGPTAPHSPLHDYPQMPTSGFSSDTGIQKLMSLGVPSEKILLGIGFYGRGWSNVSQSAPGGGAGGAAPGTYERGIEDYKVLKNTCPATGTIAGTAYAWCDGNWWGYDTPQTILGKMDYVKQQSLGGAFFWEFSGDTADGELVRAIGDGL